MFNNYQTIDSQDQSKIIKKINFMVNSEKHTFDTLTEELKTNPLLLMSIISSGSLVQLIIPRGFGKKEIGDNDQIKYIDYYILSSEGLKQNALIYASYQKLGNKSYTYEEALMQQDLIPIYNDDLHNELNKNFGISEPSIVLENDTFFIDKSNQDAGIIKAGTEVPLSVLENYQTFASAADRDNYLVIIKGYLSDHE